MTTYAEALKKWNEGKSKWCMPKKGSPEHAQVLAIKEGKSVPKIDEEECKCQPQSIPKAKATKPKEEALQTFVGPSKSDVPQQNFIQSETSKKSLIPKAYPLKKNDTAEDTKNKQITNERYEKKYTTLLQKLVLDNTAVQKYIKKNAGKEISGSDLLKITKNMNEYLNGAANRIGEPDHNTYLVFNYLHGILGEEILKQDPTAIIPKYNWIEAEKYYKLADEQQQKLLRRNPGDGEQDLLKAIKEAKAYRAQNRKSQKQNLS